MLLEGCDYVAGPPAAVLRRHGFRFVCRYVSTPGNPKNLGRAEAHELLRAGLGIVVVFETTARRALAGRTAGRADAVAAERQLRTVGAPRRQPVYFAVDFDTNPLSAGELALVVDYIRGAAQELGVSRVGVYGGLRTIEACDAAGVCRYLWQTRAWSGTPPVWHRGRHLEQPASTVVVGGHTLDIDRALRSPFGAWVPARLAVWVVIDGLRVRVGSRFWSWLRKTAGRRRGRG